MNISKIRKLKFGLVTKQIKIFKNELEIKKAKIKRTFNVLN